MAVASPVANVKGFKFGKNLPLLNQKASLGFEVSSGIRRRLNSRAAPTR
jgi:hypothetical protein